MGSAPTQIGRYEIIEEVGSGSMGRVYCAHDPFSNRLVAIKVANTEQFPNEDDARHFRKLFFNEAHAAAVLQHPNILQIFEADADGELCYLVIEYVYNAQTLEAFSKPETLLPVREIVGYIYNLAKALGYAHKQGIVHRDIKPANILLSQDGDLKLADFSVAMINRSDANATQVMGFLGSPAYMSPEQIRQESIEGPSDIFSLGVVAYQLLTGTQPFSANNLATIVRNITEHEPPSVTDLRSEVPYELAHIIKRMIAKDLESRFATGLDLAAELAELFDDLDRIVDDNQLQENFSTIRRLEFFRDFGDADIWELARTSSIESYPAGTAVIKEGETDNRFYILTAGIAEVTKGQQVLNRLQEGDCFGEMGFLAQASRSATVTAKTDLTLLEVNETSLSRANEGVQLRFNQAFIRVLIERLHATTLSATQS